MHLPKARRCYPVLIAALLLNSATSLSQPQPNLWPNSQPNLRSNSQPNLWPNLQPAAWIQLPQAQAHQVEVSQDIGGTLHIEPSDTPRAGEEVLAWFALTRKGGAPLSLAECDCRIDIYQQPELGDDQPILSPEPLAVEGDASVGNLTGIPGAKFTFPKVGAYKLVISGQPKAESPPTATESFEPFELNFDVTVAAGETTPAAAADSPSQALAKPAESPPLPPRSRQPGMLLGAGTLLVAGSISWLAWRRR